MECWVLLKNALSEEDRTGAHIVVDRAKFRHGNPSAKERGDAKKKVKRKEGN
jgi:hypothetical protein